MRNDSTRLCGYWPNQQNKKRTFHSDDRSISRKHKLVEDHPFSGDSAKCRDTVEQTFRVTFRMETGGLVSFSYIATNRLVSVPYLPTRI